MKSGLECGRCRLPAGIKQHIYCNMQKEAYQRVVVAVAVPLAISTLLCCWPPGTRKQKPSHEKEKIMFMLLFAFSTFSQSNSGVCVCVCVQGYFPCTLVQEFLFLFVCYFFCSPIRDCSLALGLYMFRLLLIHSCPFPFLRILCRAWHNRALGPASTSSTASSWRCSPWWRNRS